MNRFIRLIQSGTFVGTDYSQQVLMTRVGRNSMRPSSLI